MIEYHKVGTPDKIVVSNSYMNEIDPTMGGHPKKFLAAMQQDVETTPKTASLEKGTLLHEWIHRREEFAIADIAKPGDKLASFIEGFHYKISTGNFIPPTDKEDLRLKIDQKSLDAYESLASKMQVDDVSKIIYLLRQARTETEYNANLKEDTAVKHILDQYSYLNFLDRAKGKAIVSLDIKEQLTNAYDSLKAHPVASKLLFESGESEKEIYWEYIAGDIKLNCKSKLDNIEINHDTKTVIIKDLKSTSKSTAFQYYPHDVSLKLGVNMNSSFEYWKVYRQLAFYTKAALNLLPKETANQYTFIYYIIAVELFGQYSTCVHRVNPTWIFRGKQEIELLMMIIDWHIKNNKWDYHYYEYVNQMILT